MLRSRFVPAFVALGLLAWAAGPARAADVDVGECQACHEKATGPLFMKSSHAGVELSCEACHKGAGDHAKAQAEGKEGPGPSLKAMKTVELDDMCLGCHEKSRQAKWAGGVHERRGVSCASCHSVHDYKSTRGQLKTARDMDTCGSCHAAIRAKAQRTSHHPVREGKLDCASCHDPHDGTKPKMIQANWITEQCLTCHTEKRGPFLWEHAPVRENCALCHDPHGSNHDKLLVAKQPFLCQRCHLNTRHPGTLYDGGNTLAGGRLVATGPGQPTVSSRAVEHACKNCHQNVHGGNAPSGPYFGR
jgi:DmsE family decaheme c-type cytochrome